MLIGTSVLMVRIGRCLIYNLVELLTSFETKDTYESFHLMSLVQFLKLTQAALLFAESIIASTPMNTGKYTNEHCQTHQ